MDNIVPHSRKSDSGVERMNNYKEELGYCEEGQTYCSIAEKQYKYRWHNINENPDDLPEDGKLVIVYIVGSDIIFPLEGETVIDALKRTMNEGKRTSVGFYYSEECEWIGRDGYPMIIRPTAWKYIEPFEVEK